MIIDASKHNTSPEYARKLVERTGLTQAGVASVLGIDPRTLRRYLQTNDRHRPMPYTTQVCLEGLARGVLKPTAAEKSG